MPLNFAEALQRAQTFPDRFRAFSQTLRFFSKLANFVLRIAGYLLAIYLVHQLFFWLSNDPEEAFDRGTLVVEVVELIWDLFTLVWNVGADVLNSAILPLWNAAAFYVFEPAIVLVLEVFSLVFLRKKYEGFINEKDFAFGGFVCDSSSQVSETWCGRFGAYNQRLEQSGSETAESSITFGVATARRLSELAGDTELDVPSVDTEELIGALDGLSTQSVVMGASAFDVLFAVLYEIFETTATFIFDAVWIIIKTAFDILKLLIKSGLLQTIIGIGLDFLLIVALEIGVPMLLAGIDFFVCILQLFLWETWAAQLECMESTCFRGPDAAADLWMFSSIPVAFERFTAVMEATLNSRTGQAFTGGGQVDLVSELPKIFPTLGGSACTACVTCKFPELRAVWFAVAISVSLLMPENFDGFYSDVTNKCLTNGTFYYSLCGPRGAEQLPFQRWSALYTGHRDYDLDVVQAYAGLLQQRAETMDRAAAGATGALIEDTAKAWFEREPTLPEADQAARFYHSACRLWRDSKAGEAEQDEPQRFADFASGSVAQITSSLFYESCKRAQHRVFGDVSRAIHNLALEVSMCLEDPVECKKEEEQCLGSASGDLTARMNCTRPSPPLRCLPA